MTANANAGLALQNEAKTQLDADLYIQSLGEACHDMLQA